MLKILRTDTGNIEYRIEQDDSKATLLFLHGLGANQDQFNAQRAFFSANYQVITMNVRGHGNTTSTEPFTLAGCAQDVISLMDNLGVEQFHFVGNSMGGNIGYELLKSYENRLLSMTTFGTTAELSTSKRLTKILLFTYKYLPSSLIATMASSAGQSKASKQEIKQMMAQMNKKSLLEIVPILATFNYLDVIIQSKIPFQIFQGSKDSEINKVLLTTLSAFEQRGNFTLVAFETVGHFANLDAPEKFNATLLDYLKRIDGEVETAVS